MTQKVTIDIAKLRRTRKSLGFQQCRIAARIGKTKGHFSDIEAGRKSLDAKTFAALCVIYNVPAEDFIVVEALEEAA